MAAVQQSLVISCVVLFGCSTPDQDAPFPYRSSTEADLKDVFGRHGGVASVNVITDRETGRPRGFAFVEMEDESSAQDAIRALDGTDLGGRNIKVNQAEEKGRR